MTWGDQINLVWHDSNSERGTLGRYSTRIALVTPNGQQAERDTFQVVALPPLEAARPHVPNQGPSFSVIVGNRRRSLNSTATLRCSPNTALLRSSSTFRTTFWDV